jgi:hypothetical protein
MALSATESDVGKQGKCGRCQSVFAIQPPSAIPAPSTPYQPPLSQPGPTPSDATPGLIRVAEGISRGFSILHSNFGVFVLITLCLVGVIIGVQILGQIPCVGILIALAFAFVGQPALECGFYRACLRQLDGEQAEVGDLFAEWGQWADYLLLVLVQAGIGCGVLIPGGVLTFMGFIPLMQNKPEPNYQMLGLGMLCMFVSMAVIGFVFMFTLVSLVDRRRGFWDAIQTSWGLVTTNLIGALGAALFKFFVSLLPGAMITGSIVGVAFMMIRQQVNGGLMAACGFSFCFGLLLSLYLAPAMHCVFASIYRTASAPRTWTRVPTFGPPPTWQPSPPAAPTTPPQGT